MTEHEWLTSDDPQAMLTYVRDRLRTPGQVDVSGRKLRLFACACIRPYWASLSVDARRAIEKGELYADDSSARKILAEAFYGVANWNRGDYKVTAAGCCAGTSINVALRGPEHLRFLASGHESSPSPQQAALLRDIVGLAGTPLRPMPPVRLSVETPDSAPGSRRWADPPWLTPLVLDLAEAAYAERPGRKCGHCFGEGRVVEAVGTPYDPPDYGPCPDCSGTGHVEDGRLDPDRLAVLSDALEEAGCPEAECKYCYGRGDGLTNGTDSPFCLKCNSTGRVSNQLLTHLRSPGPHYRGMWSLDLVLGKE